MKRALALVAVIGALVLAGCGGDEETTTTTPAAERNAKARQERKAKTRQERQARQEPKTTTPSKPERNCLTPAQAEKKINEIASGIEGSQAEVEAKREAIRAIQAETCK